MNNWKLRASLLTSAAMVTMMSAPEASAQTAAAAPASDETVDAIVVTGTRLQASGFTTPTPVTVRSAANIQERGKVNIQEALVEIPSFQPSAGPSQAQRNACAGCGAATVDLRGLGSGRTLVLIDGRRSVTGDVAIIPTNLVDRVEVVTGGASAAYGSDAVAGVVNFIMNDRLEGLRLNGQYGFSQHGDNKEPGLNFAAGHSFADDKIHVIAGVDWSKNDGVGNQYERAWGRREVSVVGLNSNPALRPAGMPAFVISPYQQWSSLTTGGLITSGPLRGTAFGPGGVPYQFQYGSLVGPSQMVGGPDGYNYGVDDNGHAGGDSSQYRLANPRRRLASLGRVTFDVNPDTQVFIEGSFGRSKVIQDSSFSMTSQGDRPFYVLASNPYLPASVAAQVQTSLGTSNPSTINIAGQQLPGFNLGRLSTDLGQWGGVITNNVYRGVVGAKGAVGLGDWKWDAFFQYGEVSTNMELHPVNLARLYQAAYAVRDPATGQIVCGPTATNPAFLRENAQQQALWNQAIAVGPPGTCVPLNLFGPAQNQGAQSYIRQIAVTANNNRQLVGGFNFSGTPLSTWAGPVSLAFGGEWRKETVNNEDNPVAAIAGYYETNFTGLQGSLGVYEGYAEAGVPLLKDSMLGKSLDLNAAIRQTHYDSSGWVTTWKIGGVYDPFDWLRFRATQSRDIRAPTIANLLNKGSAVLYNFTNPTNGVNGSIPQRAIGNPDLKPEVASTFTGGFVLSPKWSFLNGFRVSVDYYSIHLKGVIANISTPQILQRYFAGQSQYAQYITFNNSPLGISGVTSTLANLNELKAQGLDFEVNYRAPLEQFNIPGRLTVSALVSNQIRLGTYSTIGGVTTQSNRVGGDAYGSQGGPIPRWRSTLTFDYNLNRFGATVQARAFTGFRFATNFVGPGEVGYSPALRNSINDNYMPGLVYWNLQLRYDVISKGSRRLQLWAQADNLFDKDPPSGALPMMTGPSIPYDFIGRTFKVGARFQM